MGDNSSNFRSGRERLNGSGLSILYNSEHNHTKPFKSSTKRMESKLLMWLFTILPTTGYGLVILLNVDNVKGWILFIIAVLYGIARLFFYVIKQTQERRLRDIEIKEKEMQLKH